MKKRRLFICLFIFVSVVLLAVGYSAISKNLSISGTLSANKDDAHFQVEFVAGHSLTFTSESSITAEASITGTRDASIKVEGLTDINHTATIYFLVQNASTQFSSKLDATLAVPMIFVHDGTTTIVDNDDAQNIFVGDVFIINATYVENTTNTITGGVTTTGTVNDDGTALIKAPTANVTELNAEGAGQTVYLKVEVTLRDVVTTTVTPRTISISFTATTIEIAR